MYGCMCMGGGMSLFVVFYCSNVLCIFDYVLVNSLCWLCLDILDSVLVVVVLVLLVVL